MTVADALAASSLGPVPANSGPGGSSASGEPVMANDSRNKTGGGDGSSQNVIGPTMGVVTAKIGQELITSLHLIKDIRRLEKYQRDFFLKVSSFSAAKSFWSLSFGLLGERIAEPRASAARSSAHGHGLVGQPD